MSTKYTRRVARRQKYERTHAPIDMMECAMIIEHGKQVLHDAAPVPAARIRARRTK